MLTPLNNKKIFIASQPVDFRLSMDGLSILVQKNKGSYLHDGSIYVFYNKNRDKIKCLFWDLNGLVLYYKRLENMKFKFKDMDKDIMLMSPEELQTLLLGMEPIKPTKALENRTRENNE